MTAPNTIRLFGTAPDSIVDGPGLRFAVFVQGCTHGCPGCHNPESQPCAGGRCAPSTILWPRSRPTSWRRA
ncbi:MAG: 4Fe-4S cluster-binding domain-containing protein [Gordonibacter pamelaeae]